MNRALSNYIEEVKSEVAALVYSDGEGYSFEDKLSKKQSPQLNIDLAEGLVQTLNYIKKQKN